MKITFKINLCSVLKHQPGSSQPYASCGASNDCNFPGQHFAACFEWRLTPPLQVFRAMTLPDEQALTYPADWEDEDRMHFLLGPFPTSAASSSLPLDDQKVQFWSSLIHCVSRATRRPVFSGREMAERLSLSTLDQKNSDFCPIDCSGEDRRHPACNKCWL